MIGADEFVHVVCDRALGRLDVLRTQVLGLDRACLTLDGEAVTRDAVAAGSLGASARAVHAYAATGRGPGGEALDLARVYDCLRRVADALRGEGSPLDATVTDTTDLVLARAVVRAGLARGDTPILGDLVLLSGRGLDEVLASRGHHMMHSARAVRHVLHVLGVPGYEADGADGG